MAKKLYIFQVQAEDHSAKIVAESMHHAIDLFMAEMGMTPTLVCRETDDDDTVLVVVTK